MSHKDMKDRADYMKEYRAKNKEKLRLYKSNWQREFRKKLKENKISKSKSPRLSLLYGSAWNQFSHDRRPGHCFFCSLRLDSDFAEVGDDKTCGECLAKYGTAFKYIDQNGRPTYRQCTGSAAATTEVHA